MPIRQPIISVLGHIDHGKTSLLDKIRGTAIAKKEAGMITQHIGATEVPIDVIRKISGSLIEKLKVKITIPGLLFIDTPGHAAFSSLRERGGSISDLAVLVVDIREGFKDQTKEAIQILKEFKVPFVVAANKIDLIDGWINQNTNSFIESISKQREDVKQKLDDKIYDLVYQLSNFGFDSERFDRVDDYTKRIAIIPTSAITGEGLSELLMVLVGLSQRYLENSLKIEVNGPGKGSIIEVKEVVGLGRTLDVILYDGIIKVGDQIVIATPRSSIVTRVRALLRPSPLRELREKGKFQRVDQVSAAAGIKIAAPNLDECVSGMPLVVANSQEEVNKAMEDFKKYIGKIIFSSDRNGVIIKADSLGSLEAIIGILKSKNIQIRKADVGDVSKGDVMIAKNNEDLQRVILAFNVKVPKEVEILARDENVLIFSSNVIYNLIENYENWLNQEIENQRIKKLSSVVLPAKIKVLRGYVFRQSKPAVFGVEVLLGEIRNGYQLMREDGKIVGRIKEIQSEGENVGIAKRGQAIAISVPEVTIGRQIKEGMELWTSISKEDYKKLKELKDLLSDDQIQALKEIVEIKSKRDPMWRFI